MIRDVDVPEHLRRRGIASELLRQAREVQPGVHHSEALTPSGRAWSERVAMLEYFMAASFDLRTQKGKRKGIAHTTITAHSGGQKVGHVRMISGGSELDDLYVHPDWRGQGVGHTLMNAALQQFGHQTIRLHASPFVQGKKDTGGLEQDPLMGFYASHGFEPEPDRSKGYMIRRPDSPTKTASGGQSLHDKARRYVEETTRLDPHNLGERFHYEPHEPNPGESDEEFADRKSLFEGLTGPARSNYHRMSKKWAQAPRGDRDEFRRRLHVQSQKPLFIGTNHAADIIGRDGRMKTLSEVGNDLKGEHYLRVRNAFEKHIMGVHEDTDPKARPIYGAATDSPEHLFYGAHHLELKPHVRKRTTSTMGDSLSSNLRNYSIDHLKDLDDKHIISMTADDEFDSMRHGGNPRSYLEFHVHGGVDRDDIARLHVHGQMTEESHNLVRTALENGVEVVHHGPRGAQVLTEPPRIDLKTHSSKRSRGSSVNDGPRLDLGRGTFAHYRRGMAESDPIDVFHAGGVRKTTWGGLLALSNGELFAQISDKPGIEDYFGGEE